jgi:hypothetical protein
VEEEGERGWRQRDWGAACAARLRMTWGARPNQKLMNIVVPTLVHISLLHWTFHCSKYSRPGGRSNRMAIWPIVFLGSSVGKHNQHYFSSAIKSRCEHQ